MIRLPWFNRPARSVDPIDPLPSRFLVFPAYWSDHDVETSGTTVFPTGWTILNVEEIRGRVKEIVAGVLGIDPESIADDDSLIDDLDLDSLSLLEVGVDVDYEFRLGVPEERLQNLRTVQEAVDLVVQVQTGAKRAVS